jgi:hypothetical protein
MVAVREIAGYLNGIPEKAWGAEESRDREKDGDFGQGNERVTK